MTRRALTSGEAMEHNKATELLVRDVPCPYCEAETGKRCEYWYGVLGPFSHIGRYRAAVDEGLVPPLPGDEEEFS